MALKPANIQSNKPAPVAEPTIQNDADPYLTDAQADAALDDEPQGGVAEQVKSAVPSVQKPASKAVSTQVYEDVGNDSSFDDLDSDLGFGSFPMVKLDNSGQFVTSDGDEKVRSTEVITNRIVKAQDELEALDTEYAEAEARESVAAGDTVSVKLGRGETAREVPAEVLGVHTDATGKKTVAVVAEDAVVLVGIGALVFYNEE